MGASVAYHLARRGVTDVVLVERDTLLGTGSTGRNAGGVRHQFSNEANIRLSIESIGVLERFADEVGQPIDFHQDGYLFLLSTPASVETFRAERRAAAQPRRRRAVARRRGRGAAGAGTRRRRRRRRDVLPARRHRRSQRRHDGVREGGAGGGRRRSSATRRSPGIRVEAGRVAAVETTRGTIETRMVVNAAGPHARQIGRMAGVDVPVDPYRRHIFIAALDGGGMNAAGSGRRRALVAHHGDRLRHDLLFPSRGRRAAVRHGRSRRDADLRHDRAVGFPAAGDRRRGQAAAGAGRRVDLARVGGPLRSHARREPDHRPG